MGALARELTFMAYSNKDGAYATQSDRKNMLQLFEIQLKEKGYKLPSARSLKPKHITYLVQRWQSEGLVAEQN